MNAHRDRADPHPAGAAEARRHRPALPAPRAQKLAVVALVTLSAAAAVAGFDLGHLTLHGWFDVNRDGDGS